MEKKIIAMILSVTMLLTLALPAFANNEVKEVLTEGQEIRVPFESLAEDYYEFTATESGKYRIEVYDTFATVMDLKLYEYDAATDVRTLAESLSVESVMETELTAGKTYHIGIRCMYFGNTADCIYTLKVSHLQELQSIEIKGAKVKEEYMGKTIDLEVTTTPEEALPETISWESDNETVATVDADGVVKCVGVGTANITATTETTNCSDSCQINVVLPTVITINSPVDITMTGDQEQYMTFIPEETGYYECYDTNNELEKMVTYPLYDANWERLYFDDPLVAGETYFIGTCFWDYEGTGDYTVNIRQLVPIAELELTARTSDTGYIGQTLYLDLEIYPECPIYEEITWTSSNPEVATVTDVRTLGTINCLSDGTTTITVQAENGAKDEMTITVKERDALSIGNPITVCPAEGEESIMTFTPEKDGWYYFYVTGSSGYVIPTIILYDKNMDRLAYNSSEGQIKYELEEGETYYIGASSWAGDIEFTVNVEEMVNAAEFILYDRNGMVREEVLTYLGDSIQLQGAFTPANAIIEDVTFTSSNPEVATVSDYGYVEPVSAGSTLITATSSVTGLTDSFVLYVIEHEIKADITVENPVQVSYTGLSNVEYYRFTPEESGKFQITGSDVTNGIGQASMTILDVNWEWLASQEEYVQYEFEAGKSYYIQVGFIGSYTMGDTVQYTMSIEKLVDATQIHFPENLEGLEGAMDYLEPLVSFTPDNAWKESVTFTSDNELVAPVYLGPLGWYVSYRKPGTATITGTFESGRTVTCQVMVLEDTYENPIWDVSVEEPLTKSELNRGSKLCGKFVPTKDATYGFSDEINEFLYGGPSYAIYADAEGEKLLDGGQPDERLDWECQAGKTYYIFANYLGFEDETDTYNITITELVAATGIVIDGKESYTGYVGDELYLWASLQPEDVLNESFDWTTDKPEVLSVHKYNTIGGEGAARVSLLAPGAATVTVTSRTTGWSDSVTITVREIENLTVGTTYEIHFEEGNEKAIYEFIPAESALYHVEASYQADETKAVCIIKTEDGEWLMPDSLGNLTLAAGETYYIEITPNSEMDDNGNSDPVFGIVEFLVTKAILPVSAIELVSLPTKYNYYDFETQLDYSGLEIKVKLADGSETIWNYDNGGTAFDYEVEVYEEYSGTEGDLKNYIRTVVSCGGESINFVFVIEEKIEEKTNAGDINGDGEADALDALDILKLAAGMAQESDFDAAHIAKADVEADGNLDALDALKILKYVAGILPTLKQSSVFFVETV